MGKENLAAAVIRNGQRTIFRSAEWKIRLAQRHSTRPASQVRAGLAFFKKMKAKNRKPKPQTADLAFNPLQYDQGPIARSTRA